MGDLAEDRVYDAKAGKQVVYAATGIGVVAVEASRERVGRFSLDHRCEARDLTVGGDPTSGDGLLAVATDEDVLVFDGEAYVETGFGPAVAVGFDEDDLLAAGPDGELGRVVHAVEAFLGEGDAEWLAVADVDGAVRAIDGPLVAASDGVYRFTADGIFDVGLTDVWDVVGVGTPRAATDEGLYRLGNGWMDELEGAFEVVTAGSADSQRGHAATDETLYELDGDSEPEWARRETPVGPVVDVAYGEGVYALAADGTFLIDRGDDWARRSLGVPDAAALAVWQD